MFKKTDDSVQFNMFSDPKDLMNEKSRKKFSDPGAWHNLFRNHILFGIDEDQFRPLYTQVTGAPNSSIKLLIGMMIIKESLQCSDKQLFEQCEFNLLVRSALGLINIDDPLPAESTYYLLRKRIYTFNRQTGDDLFAKVFQGITSQQVKEFEVNGSRIRMDSKLIGSNIAWYTRYELIHQSLRQFYHDIPCDVLDKKMNRKDRAALQELLKDEGPKVVYRCTKPELNQRMQRFGLLIYRLLKIFKQNPHYEALSRVFEEQYKSGDGLIQIRDKEEISADSVQSPNDLDCSYRDKDGQMVKGYSVNITETCSDNQLNLITDIKTVKVNTPDTAFLIEAVEATNTVTRQTVNKIHSDGAYHSPTNSGFCSRNEIDMVLTGMQGIQGRYDLNPTQDGLHVIDTLTGEIIEAHRSTHSKNEKWWIKIEPGYRYFTQKDITNSLIRKKLNNRPVEELQRRNNVEATIFQLCFFTRNNKTRYRGLQNHQVWAYCRALAINLVRIKNYIETIRQRTINASFALIRETCYNLKNETYNILCSLKRHFGLSLCKNQFNYLF
jgi:hypothetical protein